LGAWFADQVVVADVQRLQALDQRPDNFWVAMAQVEDTAVAVAINHPLFAGHIPYEWPFAPPLDELYARHLEEGSFAGGNVVGKLVKNGRFSILFTGYNGHRALLVVGHREWDEELCPCWLM